MAAQSWILMMDHASLFTKVVHPYLPKWYILIYQLWYIPIYQLWYIAIYRLHNANLRELFVENVVLPTIIGLTV
jgi:hypothetical protein